MSSKQSKTRAREAPVQPISTRPHWWWFALGIFLTLFATFEVYGPAIRGPFLFDDFYLPFMRPGFAGAPLRWWIDGVRPLLMFGYWINYQLNQAEPYWYHVVNVLLHFANAACAWLIVRKILSWAGVTGNRLTILGLFGGLLFLLHPLQTESVSYVASRSESQSLLFFNAAFAIFVYRRQAAVSVMGVIAILAMFGAAVLSKEHTAVLPALFVLTDYFWNPGFSFEGIKKNWKLYAPIAIGGILAFSFVLRLLKGATTAGFGMTDLPCYQYFFTQCRAIWVYVRMFALPYGLNIDHEFDISRSIFDHGAVLGMVALIACGVAAWKWRREYALASYGYFAFLILLAPTSSVVPIRDVLVERRVYLAFLPLTLICCEFLRRWRVSETSLAGGLAAVLCLLSFLTYQRNEVWGDPIALWKDTAEKSPHKSRPQFQFAYAYYQQGRCADASREFEKASKLDSHDATLFLDWGLAEDCANRPQEAIARFEQSLAIEKTAHAYALIGMVRVKHNERDSAMRALDEAEKLDPAFEMTYVYRGNLELLSQEFDKAATQFQKAISLSPSDQAARSGLDMAQRRVTPTMAQ